MSRLGRGFSPVPREFKDPQLFEEFNGDLKGFAKFVNLEEFNNIFHRHKSSAQCLVVIVALDLKII